MNAERNALPQRIALVTGANQGIGLQIAKDLAKHGLVLLIGARDLARGEEAANAVGENAHAVQLDVTDPASIAAAAAWIQDKFGRLDVLVNNAAISRTRQLSGSTLEERVKASKVGNLSLDEMRAVWETNVFGVVAVTQAMLPLLRRSDAARIVNVSSSLGSLTLTSEPDFAYRAISSPIYPGSKTALNAITVALAIELEAEGIKVTAACPGYTSTNLNGFSGPQTVEEGAREPVRQALLGPDGPTGTFSNSAGPLPW